MLNLGLFLYGLFKKLTHGEKVVDKAGDFAGLLLDKIRNFGVSVKILRPLLFYKLVG